jgi:uncharacterized membrane protein
MINLIKKINQHINFFVFILVTSGIILLLLGLLMAWSELILRVTVAGETILIGYVFLHLAFRLNHMKNEVIKHLK